MNQTAINLLHHEEASPEAKASARFIHRTADIWEAMFDDCQNAKTLIIFEQYILLNDKIGHRFLELFARKAEEGVAVYCLLDTLGSAGLTILKPVLDIERSGGVVKFYNPFSWRVLLSPRTFFPRNHSKILLIDNQIGYCGSACFADAMRDWRDTQLRFTGPLAEEASCVLGRSLFFRNRRARNKKVMSKDFSLLVHQPYRFKNPIYQELLHAVNGAKKSIQIVTPYFFPPFALRRALRRAVKRGVKVTIILSAKTDRLLADCTTRSHLKKFLKRGYNVQFYQPTVIHAKYVIIDDAWATVGSSNIDYLSLFRNREVNIAIRQPDAVRDLKTQFERDMAECQPATIADWKNLPPPYKALAYVGRCFERFM